jgi:hypothetical protein
LNARRFGQAQAIASFDLKIIFVDRVAARSRKLLLKQFDQELPRLLDRPTARYRLRVSL